RPAQIRHLAGVFAIEPLLKESQLGMIHRGCDAADIEPERARSGLDVSGGQHAVTAPASQQAAAAHTEECRRAGTRRAPPACRCARAWGIRSPWPPRRTRE